MAFLGHPFHPVQLFFAILRGGEKVCSGLAIMGEGFKLRLEAGEALPERGTASAEQGRRGSVQCSA